MKSQKLIRLFVSTLCIFSFNLHAEIVTVQDGQNAFKNTYTQHLAATDKKQVKNVRKQKGDIHVPEGVWQAITKTTHISEGVGNQDVYIFFDPLCSHCHNLWRQTRQFSNTTNYCDVPPT